MLTLNFALSAYSTDVHHHVFVYSHRRHYLTNKLLANSSLSSTTSVMMSSVVFRCSRLAPHRLQHSYSTISVTVDKGLRVITLQRPDKFNAFNNEMYNEVLEDLHAAAEDDQTVVAAITGAGKYFSSGNDLNSFAAVSQDLEERKEFSKIKGQRLIKFVDAFIEFPKPLIGVVNGPAIGIGCTILGLLDVVYASER